jgi:hypothetical protein
MLVDIPLLTFVVNPLHAFDGALLFKWRLVNPNVIGHVRQQMVVSVLVTTSVLV